MKHKFLDLVAIIAFNAIWLIPIYIIWGEDLEHLSTHEQMLLGLIIGVISGCCSYKFMKHCR